MPRSIVVSVLVLVGALIGALSYLAGYVQGTGGGRGYASLAEAVSTVTALSAIRSGNDAGAISVLEPLLDARLIEHSLYVDDRFQLVHFLDMPATDAKLISVVAKYRTEHPSTHPDPEVRAAVARALQPSREH